MVLFVQTIHVVLKSISGCLLLVLSLCAVLKYSTKRVYVVFSIENTYLENFTRFITHENEIGRRNRFL